MLTVPLSLLLSLIVALLAAAPALHGIRRSHETAETAWRELEQALLDRHEAAGRLLSSPQLSSGHATDLAAARNAARTVALSAGVRPRGISEWARAETRLAVAIEAHVSSAAAQQSHDTTRADELPSMRIAAARIEDATSAYNKAVRQYCREIGGAPSSMIAAVFGFAARAEFLDDNAVDAGTPDGGR